MTATNEVEIEKTDGSLDLDENQKKIVATNLEKDNLNEQNGNCFQKFLIFLIIANSKLNI